MSITKQDLDQLESNLQKEIQGIKIKLRQDIKSDTQEAIKKAIDKSEMGLRQEIKEAVDKGVDVLRVLIEEVRSDIKFGFEARDPHEEKLQKHDQKLENHETRLTTLEDYAYTKDRLR